MKIFKLFLALIMVASCTQQKNKFKIPPDFFQPIEITRPHMEQLINYLPLILDKAKQFQQFPKTQQLTDAEYNMAFYAYIYTDTNIASALIKSGFPDVQYFGSFYNSVLESFILIQKNPEIIQEAVVSIPKIQKELDPLLLKQAREKNNQTLNQKIESLQSYLLFYKNLILIDQFVGILRSLNEK
ncbi:MAG: hypothetical protein ACRCVW_00890 [Brevinema sp.]